MRRDLHNEKSIFSLKRIIHFPIIFPLELTRVCTNEGTSGHQTPLKNDISLIAVGKRFS